MEFREMQADEISRIGEVNREELVMAEYVTVPDDSGFGLRAVRTEKSPPEQTPHWSRQGAEGRANSWKPSVEQGGYFYGAFDGDLLAGFVILGPRKSDDSGEIVALFVHRDQRRTGIGRKLMRKAEEEAIARGYASLFLYSNPTESAVGFYLKEGYRIVGLISKEIVRSLPGDIVMAKRLER
jgi:ribosomal protein S18 acetylase RimI-like enzyme